MCGYKYRDILLKELGFQNYKYYLSSELWRNDIRPRVIDEYKHNLLGKSLDGMIVLCRKCHKRAEFTRAIGGGKHKRSLREANEYITDIIIEKMTKI